MSSKTVGERFSLALNKIFGDKNSGKVSKKYGVKPQTIIGLKKKTKLNETISLICEKENINLNWIQSGKGEMFLNKETEKSSTTGENKTYAFDVLNIKASAGGGSNTFEVEVVDQMLIDKSFFKNRIDTTTKRFIEVEGDSMYPTLKNGDMVLIDETIKDGVDDVYAINYGGKIRIKRLQFRMDGKIIIKSDNEKYDDEVFDPSENQEHFHIIGKRIMSVQW